MIHQNRTLRHLGRIDGTETATADHENLKRAWGPSGVAIRTLTRCKRRIHGQHYDERDRPKREGPGTA